MRCQTPGSSPAARTRTSTSPSPISGVSMSLSSNTSGPPYLSWTIAFIALPQPYLLSSTAERPRSLPLPAQGTVADHDEVSPDSKPSLNTGSSSRVARRGGSTTARMPSSAVIRKTSTPSSPVSVRVTS